MEKSVIDNRKATRLPIAIKFKFKVIGSSAYDATAVFNASSKNISCLGMLFENEMQFPLDTELKITLQLPGIPAKTIEVQGKVIRLEKLSVGGYDIGVVFSGMSSEIKDEVNKRIERMNIIKLLEKSNKREISDLHLTVNSPPIIRCYGEIKPLDDKPLSSEEIKEMIYSILTEEQKATFEKNKDLDFAFSPFMDSRFRVSIYQQRGIAEVVFRNILPNIKTREDLGLPSIIDDLCQFRSGIIFISGPTGSGKTTTITTMVDAINKQRSGVILTLEKPIEYLHINIKSIVKQREVGVDVPTFASGLKAALRQDPDVIVVGEVLDSDTIETALQAAETGHLVITSIHATDTIQVFDRILSLFSAPQRDFICTRLSHSLRAVINQKLLPHKNGIGRIVATEICTANMAVKRIIKDRDFIQLASIMQTGMKYKMCLMQDSVTRLFEQNMISAETYEMYTKQDYEGYSKQE